ncbi:ABC transporter ATP-binding protein [Falsiroseomonas selenitidurans]|uniref:ATP-binding cassette domain-containing protein n=1 Tax=Falsiroseomonas selenitidurans TaxID=2716335 RepID=A0ABX1E0K2_9PROT|nr:oligopeptide/dipeptide ABC transporter ATP-binding protein [Falsiroseomonas selenitidurans]NKC29292.1 ATP-binding cassette domain-containing protein [Falsiroseomonas selenitidurans]
MRDVAIQGVSPTFGSTGAGPMLETHDVARHFDVSRPLVQRLMAGEGRRLLRAVDGVSFAIARGTTLSLVGESGCGKSTVARLVVGLYPPSRGGVTFDGQDLAQARREAAQRRRMQMIFQDPYASLNPRWRVADIIAEPIRAFGLAQTRAQIEARVAELLTQVGLSPLDGQKFPHEFSGGQRQRISIARALSSNPEFLVCDEPTSALDVSVQAQILNLMKDLQARLGLTYLFISHNLAVVRQVSDRVGVMYLGRLVELAPAETLFETPRHPYTKALMEAIPDLEMTGRQRIPVGGEVPSPIDPPSGCPFHPRCPLANDRCKAERPEMIPARGTPQTLVACHAVEEGRDAA